MAALNGYRRGSQALATAWIPYKRPFIEPVGPARVLVHLRLSPSGGLLSTISRGSRDLVQTAALYLSGRLTIAVGSRSYLRGVKWDGLRCGDSHGP